MVSARKFEQHLLSQSGGLWSSAHMDAVHRTLQAAGLVTKGGHGVNAPDCTPLEAAHLLLALVAERPADAAETVNQYQGLESTDGSGFLLGFLRHCLEAPAHAGEVETVTFFRTWPRAEVWKTDGTGITFEHPEAQPRAAYTSLTIRGSLLAALALSLLPVESGWTGKGGTE